MASIGASGLALLMGRPAQLVAGGGLGAARAFLGGVVALELAAAFPVIGWLLVIPGATLLGLGAAVSPSSIGPRGRLLLQRECQRGSISPREA